MLAGVKRIAMEATHIESSTFNRRIEVEADDRGHAQYTELGVFPISQTWRTGCVHKRVSRMHHPTH